ncbi:conserved hypothetical protein [Candidatus Desulfarcum epimagneticum]|uniref:Endonuclease GajA/Old nuclease/RecF-like AAA domain-containing protein n=1 Tax=uncultured Desulfobacteraceae bacterium TaxID=218296 RepID=A0A484HMU5_9BACT|nr:conserved hypothetical protein [uncultured Desulfobacteraceae bacterium]
MLTKIKIEGLFDKFEYEIELKEQGVTILTGPNGYGKTTILRILYAFSIKNLAFFFQLPFTRIVLTQGKAKIKLSKKERDTLEIQLGNKKPSTLKKATPEEYPRYKSIGGSLWIDTKTGAEYEESEMPIQILGLSPEMKGGPPEKAMPDFVDAYLISENRLIKKPTTKDFRVARGSKKQFIITIEEYAKELSENLNHILSKASKAGQELDSSFPRRLFDETQPVEEEEFNERYGLIRAKQKSLSAYGLSPVDEDTHTSFKQENAKALRVYLNDTEKKLAVFDDILKKLELFSSILNKRGFVSKKFEISPNFGFRFKTRDEKELSLTDLSSGEQQEVVLLYELLFKVGPNTLVLIDEPEISLHVAWQKEVVDDFMKIIDMQKITVITATHSPQIIGKYWDLVVDLKEISE